jgi:hypothetical protein
MNKFAIVASLAAGLILQAAAQAGQVIVSPVIVSSGADGVVASGALGATRQSADTSQEIGCDIASDAVSSAFISCFAIDAVGNQAYCSVLSPSQAALNALSSMNSSSFIYFTANTTGTCTYLSVSNGSTSL